MKHLKEIGGIFALVILIPLVGVFDSLSSPSSANGQNLVLNPGFEAGTENWALEPSTATFELVDAPVHSGSHAASLTKTESTSWAFIYQDVPVTAGTRYTASVWALWNDEQLSNVKLRVDWLDAGGDEIPDERDEVELNDRRPEYQSLRLEGLEAPAGAMHARIQGYTFVNAPDPQQPALFDDFYFAPAEPVTVTATPGPTSTATTTPTVVLPSPTLSPTATPTPTRVPAGAVVINEVFYDPAALGGDPDDEWVEVYNKTQATVDLDGWILADHIGEDVLPALELPPYGFAVVAASGSFAARYPAFDGLLITLDGPIGNGLANGGDSLWLRDDQGRIIDAVSYGDDTATMLPAVPAAPEGYSLERVPFGQDTDTAADWFPRAVPSPGKGVRIWRRYFPLVEK